MTRQAYVGAFTLLALLALFGVYYFIVNLGVKSTGYRVGVHFQSAAGLTPGALVYFSGVNVGSVDSIDLLPDNTVEVVVSVNRNVDIPASSKFLIQSPLTGSPNLIIVPPRGGPGLALLPRQVLPIDQQPQGTNTATVADLMQQGEGEIKKFDIVMTELEQRTPKLLDSLQVTLNNANQLTVTASDSLQTLSTRLIAASANIDSLSQTLNVAATNDSGKLSGLLDHLNATSIALNNSMTSLESIATNPKVKANLISTTQSIADATAEMAALAKDLRTVTGDPATQEQMRNTVANLNAVMQKTNSLLGELGATSNVYGVDANATPPPPYAVPSGSPYPYQPQQSGGGNGTAPPAANATSGQHNKAALQSKLAALASNLVNFQVRLSGLSVQQNAGLNPVMTKSQGPLGDINMVLLPHSPTGFMVGANAIGNNTTWNAILQQTKGPFVLGGGVLYSQIGALAQYNSTNHWGLETRVYDLTYPMIDLYGNVRLAPGTQVFFGERDTFHASRRATAGLQYQF